MRSVKVARKARLAVACLLGATALTPFGADAQDADWLGATGQYVLGSNWTGGSPPDASGTATFGATGTSTVDLSGATGVGTFQFDSLAQAYTFSGKMLFHGSGIVNNSANVQTFTATGAGTGYTFWGSAAAGNATFSISSGASMVFDFAASAGTATINLNDGDLLVAGTGLGPPDPLRPGATLANATVTASNGASVRFLENGSGGQARITLIGAGSSLQILQLTSAGTTIGSLAGTEGQVSLGNKQLTVGGNNQSTSFGGNIFGSGGSIVKEGAGTWTLSGSNNYTGGTTINAGTISIEENNNLGNATGTLTFGGGTLRTTATFTTSRATTLNAGGGTFEVAGGTTLIQNGVIGGAGGLTKTGAGTLVLTGVNTYLGGTTINAGAISISAENHLGNDLFGSLTFGGGTLQTTATFITSRAMTLNAGGGTFDVASITALSVHGIISGSGELTKTGGGTLVLGGLNDYTGATIVNAGTLALAAFSSIASSSGIFLGGSGTVFDISLATNGASISTLSDVAPTPPASGSVINLGSKTLTITNGGSFFGTIQDGGLGGGTGGGLTLADSPTPTTLSLFGTTTYTGATTIGANATLELNNDATISNSSSVNLTGSGAVFDISCSCISPQTIKDLTGVSGSIVRLQDNSLTVGTANSTTFAGIIDDFGGNGGLIKQGSGTLTLTGTNTYTGGTTIIGGLINFTTLDNFGTGNVTLNGGGVQWATGNTIDISPRLAAIGNNGGTFDTNGNNVTLAANLSGMGGLTKAGSGTLTLEGQNSYIGATTINAGTLALASFGSISNSSLVTVASGATFDISASSFGYTLIETLAGSGTVQLGGNGLVIVNASGEFGGTIVDIGGAGGLQIFAGSMTLTNASTYGNVTQVWEGATLALKGAGSIANSLYISFVPTGGGGTAVLDISQTTAGASVRGLFDPTAGGIGIVNLGGKTLTITNGTGTFNGVLQDGGLGGGSGGGLTLAVNAQQSLGGANTYTGATTIGQDAVLSLTGSGSIATSSGVNLAAVGATLDITGSSGNQTILDLVGVAGTKVVLGSHTLTVGTSNSTMFAGTIADDDLGSSLGGSLIKVGSGTLTLGGINAYSGATTISAGTLALSSADISASSMVIVGTGATFDVSDNVATQITALTGNGTVKLGSSAGLMIAGASGEFSGVITSDLCGCSTFAIGGGVQTLSGTNTYAGITVLAAGATLALKGAGSIASSTGVEFVPFGPGVATFDISQVTTGATVLGLADLDGVGVVSLGSKTLTVGANGGPFAGIIQDGGIGGGTGGGLTVASPGFGLQLAGINTYTGATTIEADGLLAIVGPGSIAASSGVDLAAAGAKFDISGSDAGQTIKDLSGVAGTTVALGGNSLTVGTATSTIFAGIIADGGFYGGAGGSLVKQGSGTLTLTGANTYSGGTTVSAGTLQGNTTSLQGNIVNDASVVFDQASTGTYAGVMSGSGVLTKTGVGTLILTANNTYGGGTTINGGTISISQDANLGDAGGALTFGGGTLQTTANISMSRTTTLNAGGGTFDVAAGTTLTQNGIIGGSGGLTKTGSGTLVLTEDNAYSGGTTISGGILQLGNGGTIGSIAGNVGMSNNAILAFNRSDDIVFAGDISGAGRLMLLGPGTVTLTGTSSYTGGTIVGGGTVEANSDAAFGAAGATLEVANGATVRALASFISNRPVELLAGGGVFDTNGNTLTLQGTITGDGGLTKTGLGTLELAGGNTYSGATTINAGTLALSGAGSLSTSSLVTVATGATFNVIGSGLPPAVIQNLAGSGTVQLSGRGLEVQNASGEFAGTIAGNSTLLVSGGAMTLSGVSTYIGSTEIARGATLALKGTGSIANSSEVGFGSTGSGTGVFDISQTTAGASIRGFAGSSVAGVVNLGRKTLTITGVAGTFVGVLQDGGLGGGTGSGLTLAANAQQTLAGANTYTGATTVNANATLWLSGTGSIASSSGLNLAAAGAVFDISNSTVNQTIRDLEGVAGSVVRMGIGLTAGTSNSTTFGGIIAGTGSFTKQGTGTLTLTGASSYTGGTVVNAGVLRLGAGGSLAATGALTVNGGTFDLNGNNQTVGALAGTGGVIALGGGTLTTNSVSDTVLAAAITGSGGFVKQGNGALTLTGANTYTGDTTVSGGTLIGTTTSLQGNITNNAAVVFSQSTDGTYAGNMSGTGGLTKTGSGNVTLTGTNTYSGDTVVSGGTLTGTTTSLQGNITNDANVVFDQASNGIYAGVMSGSGVLTKTGVGTLILTANNTYTGDTIIAGGILQLGNGGTTGMIAGDVFNFGTLAFNRSDDITFAGNISGSGNIAYMGPGTVTLTGTNTYTGGTAITGGTVQAGSDSALGAAGTTLTMINGTLQATASFTVARPITLTTPGGTFDTNGNTLTLQGAITGTGGLTKTGAGTLILDGTNSYSGGTTVTAGLLQGTTSSLQGNITNNAAVAFSQNTDGTYAGTMSGTGGLTKTGTGNVTLTGTNTYSGGTTVSGGTLTGTTTSLQGNIVNNAAVVFSQSSAGTYAGNMSGTGGLTKSGSGNVTLTGSNSYTGGTTVSGGTLTGTTTSLQGNIVNNATVVFDQASSVGVITLGPGAFPGGSTTMAGGILNGGIISSTGTLTKAGAGTLVLTGANTYSGGTTVSGGTTLTIGTNTYTGGTTVMSGFLSDGIYADIMSGNGALTKTGSGVLTLMGSNSYSGGTTVSGGTTLTSGANTYIGGTTVMSGFLSDGTYAGNMSGSGALIKTGSGVLTLMGSNSYTGGTTVSGGVLQGTSSSLQGNITNNAVVAFSQSTDGTYAGTMSGTGSLAKTGWGNLTLTGTNSYSGGTTVWSGTLTGNATSLQGNIVNNAALIFDQATAGTYAGALSGTGTLTKTGAGQLVLTGNNVVGGGTTVSAGLLTVNGSLTSNVVVGSGGMIGGSGTIIGQFASNGGIVAPGNSIGTLNVTGNFSQTGGVYQVEANSAGQSDKIVATGTATIGGGATVQVLAASGTYARNTTYTIVTATGGLTGTYGGVTSNLAFLTPSLSYDANNVYLLLEQTANAFAAGAQTRNQYAVGTALDIASPTATGDFNTVLNALAALDTQQGPAALNTISGQPYTGFGTVNIGASMVFMNALGQQVAQARNGGGAGTRVALAEACVVACDTADLPKWGAWMSGLGGFGSVGGNTNTGTLTYNLGGAAVGVDYRLDPRFLVGLAVGYSSGRQWVNGFQGNGNADNYSAALYASFTQGGFYADALAGYAYSDNRMQRVMAIPGLATRIANGQVGANQFLGQIEAGYRIGVLDAARATITPFARFQTVAVSQNAFNESGAQSLNLNVAQQNTTSVRTIIGADLGANIPVGMERPLGITIRLGWAHEYADTARPMTAAFAGAPTVGFTVYGAQPLRDAAVVGFGLNAQIGASTSIYARYDGEITGRDDTHSLSAGFRMTW